MKGTALAARMQDIQPFHVMKLLARARALEAAGRHIVHLEIGEPDFPTAAPIVAAGRAALAAGHTHYTPATGLPELRQALSDHYRTRYGLEVAPRRILITPGASGALQLLMAALVDPGRQVLMSDPGYPCNRNFVRLVEGEALNVPTDAEHGYQLTPELAERHWTARSAALLVASPSNPAGTLLDREQLAALAAFAEARGGSLIVDEIYHGLTYDCEATSALAVSERVFVLNSFSKFYGMTGWRLGWLVAPEDAVEALDTLAQNLFLAAPTPAQWAALAAFEPEAQAIFEQRRQAFRERRDYLLPALRELGFRIPLTPGGAFYLYADCSALTDDSFEFSQRLLEEAGVAVTPGLDFGRHQAARHLRFAYTTSLDQLEEGVRRIAAFLDR
ncbi:pyridoxal phosphate-dependent aminotransferase [Thiohalobacter sp. IOR34]|uniref:pyridoxal phosphate-dependent aminotransferase n=1 Tax=Thiohalobacter sp. IOR34 TaxID=3057176 RepID=UPI0025AED948|nr:pyridoxal phosphate-dependent aminotransferase [Thiohalobacter sp. IOR34]WJW76525.1 pyridoxal phosphate-dependent aminotransferase [Thiohalobacter sp. IOR34]